MKGGAGVVAVSPALIGELETEPFFLPLRTAEWGATIAVR